MSAFINVILPVFIIVAIGYLLGRAHRIDTHSFSTVVLYVFSPAIIVTSLYHTTVAWQDVLRIALFVVAYLSGVITLSWLVARGLRLNRSWEGAFILSTAFANVGNFGLPVVLFAFGQEGLQYASIVFVTSGLLIHWLATIFATRARFTLRQSIAQIFRMPLIYATTLSLLLSVLHIVLPEYINRPLQLLGTAAIPIQVLLLGLQMSPITSWGQNGLTPSLLSWAIVTRLIGGVIIAFIAAELVGLSGVARQAALVQTAMPTAITSSILATQFNAHPEFVTSVVLFSTIASLVTVTVVLNMV
jgi:hypothetical protein